MNENQGTITITIDEYFNLRTKAESYTYMTQCIEQFRTQLDTSSARIMDLEYKLKCHLDNTK